MFRKKHKSFEVAAFALPFNMLSRKRSKNSKYDYIHYPSAIKCRKRQFSLTVILSNTFLQGPKGITGERGVIGPKVWVYILMV